MNRLIINGVLPSVNHMYTNAYTRGRTMKVLTADAEDWKNAITLTALAWRVKEKWKKPKEETKTVVKLWYFFPDRRKRDTHNTLKLLLDCFEDAQIYENDQFALPRIMDWQVDRENPRVEIEFEVMESGKSKPVQIG